ncbi:hypothetical protein [Anaerotignum lactatifermentans]|uniref:hypothetical protein n=1 Tax=Anaerotignum lactatifermentans TaxID=160404 RepID=UPI00187673D7|nr:hypothetical protein [Anaerotignum lactatifermentans]MBE5076534.1 hypothetical protein [Anaerotignum lactatifermentans]
MGVCKYRVSDRCMKSGFNCIFDKKCFEPEEKPVETNADRIRSMNDEELARQLVVKVDDVEGISLFLSLPTERMFITKSIAEKITLEWLKKIAE